MWYILHAQCGRLVCLLMHITPLTFFYCYYRWLTTLSVLGPLEYKELLSLSPCLKATLCGFLQRRTKRRLMPTQNRTCPWCETVTIQTVPRENLFNILLSSLQFGGFCAWGIAAETWWTKETLGPPGNPDHWELIDGALYFFTANGKALLNV